MSISPQLIQSLLSKQFKLHLPIYSRFTISQYVHPHHHDSSRGIGSQNHVVWNDWLLYTQPWTTGMGYHSTQSLCRERRKELYIRRTARGRMYMDGTDDAIRSRIRESTWNRKRKGTKRTRILLKILKAIVYHIYALVRESLAFISSTLEQSVVFSSSGAKHRRPFLSEVYVLPTHARPVAEGKKGSRRKYDDWKRNGQYTFAMPLQQ